jgi:tetratricopeptide (TPR) repeat protein
MSTEEAGRQLDILIGDIEQPGALQPVTRNQLASQLIGREELILEAYHLGKGRSDLAEGRVLYERAEFEAAASILERASQSFEMGLQYTTQTRDLHEALLLQGLCHMSMDDKDGAKRIFSRLVELDPTRELDPIHYPPDVLKLYKDVWERIHRQPFGMIAIVVEGEQQADVWVDGVARGAAPIVVMDLPPGLHHIRIQSPDGASGYQTGELSAGQTLGITMQLSPPQIQDAARERRDRSKQARRLYQVLGEHIESELILLAGQIDASTVAVQLYEPRTGNFSKILRADISPGLRSDTSISEPVEAIVDLIPSLMGYISPQGQISPDRVSFKVIGLNLSANPWLASRLLNPSPLEAETIVVTKMPRWVLWAGLGTVAAVAVPTTIAISGRDTSDDIPTDNGTIIVGPIP